MGRTDGPNVTAMTWRWPPIALGAGACFGTELDGKRIGGHGQGKVDAWALASRVRRHSHLDFGSGQSSSGR
jgi:hypothetical protein